MTDTIQIPSRPERQHNADRLRWWKLPIVAHGGLLCVLAVYIGIVLYVVGG
jgi:hypothetical protein